MKFKHVLGECDSKEWISPKLLEEGGVAYWLIVKILNLADVTGDKLFHASVNLVMPDVAGDDWKEGWENLPEDEAERAGYCFEYGYHAPLWQATGANPLALMVEAVKEACAIPESFDERMSAPLNRLGWNGWVFCGAR